MCVPVIGQMLPYTMWYFMERSIPFVGAKTSIYHYNIVRRRMNSVLGDKFFIISSFLHSAILSLLRQLSIYSNDPIHHSTGHRRLYSSISGELDHVNNKCRNRWLPHPRVPEETSLLSESSAQNDLSAIF